VLLTAYITVVVAAGGVALWRFGAPDPTVGALALLFWFLANLLGEVLWLPAPKGRGYLSMANAANFATLILLPVSAAIGVTALAGLVADLVFRRRKWYQGLFNFAACAVTVGAASVVYTKTGGANSLVEDLLSPLNALPLFLAAVTYFMINTWLVSGVVSLETGRPLWNVWRTSFAFSYEMVGAVVLKLLGYLFAILFLTWGYMSAFLAVIATYFVRDAYIRYVSQIEGTPARAERQPSEGRLS
jgi:hypothetical protein